MIVMKFNVATDGGTTLNIQSTQSLSIKKVKFVAFLFY